MPLIAPILDDRSFEDLYAELRNRIPVYNPSWTDHLDSDPGITLLQLFAYLGEGLQFRFNQIPEATQIAFLKLLDLPLEPARAARALLRFESKVGNGVVLYGGDQVKAGKTVFTLTHDATIWPLDCVAVARRSLLTDDELSDSARVSSYIEGLDSELSVAVKGSVDALRLAQGEDLPVAPYEVLTMASDGLSPPLDFSATVDACVWIGILKKDGVVDDPLTDLKRVAGRTLSLSLGFAPAVWYPGIDEVAACGVGDGPSLIWQASLATLKKDGSPDYTPVRVAGDTSGGFTRQGVVRLELPADLAPLGVPQAPAGLAGTGDFPPELDDDRGEQLWFWLRVWRGDGSRIGEVSLLTLNAVAGEQSVAAAGELLGSGSGQPGQLYQLAHAPVLPDARYPVRLQVEESGVWTDWTQVDTLDASLPTDRHFSLDAEAGTVRFGDGLGGRLPQLGERLRVMGYRWGGGAAGNVPARAIDKVGETLVGPLPPPPLLRPGQVALKCSNPLPAYGGADSESLDAALRRIPGELRRNHRAVARDDFAELAMQTPAVLLGRAECLPLFHAPSRSRKPGTVSVVVWPARDAQHPNAPLPDAWELTQVCGWLDRWRLVTTELYVIPPTYRRIALAISVKVRDGYGLDAVRDWLEILLRQYLAPLPPYGPDGHGWPLGRRLLARELEGVAMQVEGVEYLEALRLDAASTSQDGTVSWAATEIMLLNDWEVPEVAAIIVVDDATALPAPGTGLLPPLARPAVPVPVLRDVC
ncbi:MAG TPA: putative baseplate assembly protein [Accumulibacter sp.]|uniref:putative baseplate assembly protein n=1 Tax=Accumulibacter sp. TaxID=2053492 RepID=UPI002C0736B8|nr:putative baseplate assembly protein [Accumulibacter sp.]HRF73877.1 putative baseplate assembly protein [Accumulibacter sp.]